MPLTSRHEVTVEWGESGSRPGCAYYPSYFRWWDPGNLQAILGCQA